MSRILLPGSSFCQRRKKIKAKINSLQSKCLLKAYKIVNKLILIQDWVWSYANWPDLISPAISALWGSTGFGEELIQRILPQNILCLQLHSIIFCTQFNFKHWTFTIQTFFSLFQYKSFMKTIANFIWDNNWWRNLVWHLFVHYILKIHIAQWRKKSLKTYCSVAKSFPDILANINCCQKN